MEYVWQLEQCEVGHGLYVAVVDLTCLRHMMECLPSVDTEYVWQLEQCEVGHGGHGGSGRPDLSQADDGVPAICRYRVCVRVTYRYQPINQRS